MATIRTSIALYDGVTSPLASMNRAMNIVLNSFEAMQSASSHAIDTAAIQNAREELARAETAFDAIENEIRDANQQQSRFNNSVRQGGLDAGRLVSKFKTLAATIAGFAGIKKLIDISDEFASSNARLNILLDASDSMAGVKKELAASEITTNANVDASVSGSEAVNELKAGISNIRGSTDIVVNAVVNGADGINNLAGSIEQIPKSTNASVNAAVTGNAAVDALNMSLGQINKLTNAEVIVNISDNGSLEELQNKIMASAQRSRAAYFDVAGAVSKFGINAKDAFGSIDEVIKFTELVNKQFVIGGAGAQEQSAAMLQLTQAMASGVLRGEELNSVFEQAPLIIQNIADYLDKPIGSIRAMAADGLITADIVKNAMFAASDSINEQFESMPMTWAQIWVVMKNKALSIFSPILSKLNEIANSDRFMETADGILNALAAVAKATTILIGVLSAVGAFFVDNWSMISPFIYGIVGAITALTIATTIYNGVQGISNSLKAISAARDAIKGGATLAEAAATEMATGAQVGFNAALLACPLTWIILLIIVVVAAIYGIVHAINKAKGTTYSATGLIMGAFATLGAFIGNTVIMVYNIFADAANFIANVFNDPVAAVKMLFLNMSETILGYIQKMMQGIETMINKIPGVEIDITSKTDNILGWLNEKQTKVKAESGWKEYVSKIDYFDYTSAAKKGYDIGVSVKDKVTGIFDASALDKLGAMDYSSALNDLAGNTSTMNNALDDACGNTGNTAENTAAMRNALDSSKEELRLLREIAEREAINKFTTAEIKITMNNNNAISGNDDIDGFINELEIRTEEAITRLAEGDHI